LHNYCWYCDCFYDWIVGACPIWRWDFVFHKCGRVNFFLAGASTGYGTATGGSSSAVTVGGINYTLLSFTTDSNLVVSTAGLFDVLLFGGGGGGGSTQDADVSGGGGGAGGFVQSTIYLAAATYAVDIGAGGVGTSQPTNGFCSSIDTVARSLAVSGGGFGGGYTTAGGAFAAGIGGAGGGGSYQPYLTGAVSALPTVGGFAGGTSVSSSQSAAGGGGVTAVGVNRVSNTVGGAGGAGYDVNAFTGSGSLFKGGGGGGGGSITGGAGGSSVGAAGGSNGAGNAASANTAGGGGGAGAGGAPPRVGGSGGSGIVYVRFKV